MIHAATVLAMHSEMHTLFPNRPDRWNWLDTQGDVEKTISNHGADVDILLSASIEKLDKAMLARFPNLKMVASVSAGFSNIDLDECRARGIAVTNAPGMNSSDVADLAVAMMTSLLLRIPQTHDYIMTDQWVGAAPPLRHSIRNMPVGIVGLGSIGKEVLARLTPFGVDVKWWGPRPKPDIETPYVASVEDLADQCRGLIICCRPGDTTRHLINNKILDRLGPDGVLVNVSRGSVVDEAALIEALKSNQIGGAGLDVFDPEPTNSARWADVPNVILTPHQGGATFETLFAQAQLAQSNIENFIDGETLNSSVL
ncbi:MAG: 2-hydroxyacid dehydrogenase [Pseudomonadota bacterium]|nr:2-hydroxyacid dehydrogenase [Pseudomonadota bacterium]